MYIKRMKKEEKKNGEKIKIIRSFAYNAHIRDFIVNHATIMHILRGIAFYVLSTRHILST